MEKYFKLALSVIALTINIITLIKLCKANKEMNKMIEQSIENKKKYDKILEDMKNE